MSKNKTWAAPGWPWELDILALIFVVLAVWVPYDIFQECAPAIKNPAILKLKEQTYTLWSIGICILFAMHLAVANVRMEALSTPFVHLVSPLIFAFLAYYRIFVVSHDFNRISVINGSAGQIALLAVAIILITLIVAKLRMARYLHRFRDVQWDLICRSPYDSTYLELMAQFRPLVYPPRRYRASEQGVLVEGWFYTIVIPFETVQTINPVRSMGIASAGNYYATSSRCLVRFELLDSDRPLFISPENRDEFLQYCARHVARVRPSTSHHSRHGTSPGVTARIPPPADTPPPGE